MSSRRADRRAHPGRLLVGGVLGVLVLFWSGTSGTLGAWTSGSVINTSSSALSGLLSFSHGYSGGPCALGPRVSASTSCPGSIAPATPTASRVDSISNTGTMPAAGLTSSVTISPCAPVKLDDVVTTADPMLARYGTTFQQGDKWGTTSAVTLDGTTGYSSEVTATDTGTLLGAPWSIGLWFKVANGYGGGGALMGLSSSWGAVVSGAATPALWMDSAGKIRFRIAGTLGLTATGVSSSSYNNGGWHLAVLSVPSLLAGSITLSVDGISAATAGNLTALTGGTYYWHAGWADFTGIASAPTSAYLAGSLSGAFVRGDVTSLATAATLTGLTTAASYQSAVTGLGSIQHLWMLGDTGTMTFAGTLPIADPCTMLTVSWTFATPSSTTPSDSLAILGNNTPRAVPPPSGGATQTSTITTARNGFYVAEANGLLLSAPITYAVSAGTATTLSFSWAGAASAWVL